MAGEVLSPSVSAPPTAALEARAAERLRSQGRRRLRWQVIAPLAVGIALVLGWEIYARGVSSPLVPTPSRVFGALPTVLGDPDVWKGLINSDLSLLLGYAMAVGMGIPLGLLMGRVKTLDTFLGPLVDVAMVTPMVVVMPVVLMALGLTRQSQAIVIFLFAIPFVTVPCRAGARAVPEELTEMARSFGARESRIWREVLIPGSVPGIATGLRLGFGQAITGLVVVELTLLAIGVGQKLLSYQSSFKAAELFALVLVITVQSVIVMGLLRAVESRLSTGARTRVAQEAG